jgi:hypothetical protein
VDDGCVRQAAKFVDEFADCDDRRMVGCLVMTLTHDLVTPSLRY